VILGAFPSAQPLHGLIGGLLIGLAGAVMLLGLGRIAGVSGIAARASGISRLSQRSLVATGTFIAAGVATVFLLSKIGLGR
jgi:uncharacterized membrane protein YedE/YeeE